MEIRAASARFRKPYPNLRCICVHSCAFVVLNSSVSIINDGLADVPVGGFQEFLCILFFDAADLRDDENGACEELLVDWLHRCHEIPRDMPQLDHCHGRNHVERHFLRGARLHARRAADDLRASAQDDGMVREFGQPRADKV